MRPAFRLRPRPSALPWRQLLTLLAGVAVIVAMVVVARIAQSTEDHHHRIEVLAGQVRADSHELGEFAWEELALATSGGREHKLDATELLSRGLKIWNSLYGAVNSLRAADSSPMTITLLRDAGDLYNAGVAMLPRLNNISTVGQGLQLAQTVFTPAIDRLDRDSLTAASRQQRVAGQAATRARFAYVGSLLIGVSLLVALGFQFYRTRRRSLIVDQERAIERRTEERIRALVEHSSDLITVLAPDLTIRWQSPAIEKTLGERADSVLGRRLTELVHARDALRIESHIAAAISKSGNVGFTARFRHHSGEWRDLEVIAENRLNDPLIEGVVLSMRDITERKALEDELRHQAFHDGVTGLANRALFEDRLAHALAGARRHGRAVAVLFLDLDDFKTVNDSLGHSSGDELLRAVAIRIATVVRVTDTAARLGGDEFGVLLESTVDEDEGETIARRLLEVLEPPFRVGDRELRISASIGVAKCGGGSCGVDELLRNADTAMYAAKDAGKATMQCYEDGMHQRILDRLELTTELQRALQHDELVLDYQPIVELHTGQIIAAEALVRWAHPTRGRLAPGQFIGLAEETGLIVPLGAWVLGRACGQAAGWQRAFTDRNLKVNVNVSPRQLHHPDFPRNVAEALSRSGLAPKQLVLEITESVLPEDNDEIVAQLEQLKALGVLLAVDDFGTGYSALSRLRAYPIDILKIDRSFIDGIDVDPNKRELVRGIVDLCQTLHMSIVAEGIEEPEQAEELRRMHAQHGQGYAFSRPVGAQNLDAMLSSGSPLSPASARGREAESSAA